MIGVGNMRILLTNHHFFNFGGTENYTMGLARALTALGHSVDIYVVTKQDKMPAYDFFKTKYSGIGWFIERVPPNQYDLILMNHSTSIEKLKKHRGYKIFTSHGLPGIEVPVPGADHYVFISPELFSKYPKYKNKSIIKTGFSIGDFEEFTFEEPLVNPTALLIDYAPITTSTNTFTSTCKRIGVWSEIFSIKNINPLGMRQVFKGFDIMCATGRTALESALYGKRTIVYGHFGADGVLKPELDKCNFSGRYTNNLISFEESLRSVLSSSKKSVDVMRKYLKKERDIELSCKKYLKIYEENRNGY